MTWDELREAAASLWERPEYVLLCAYTVFGWDMELAANTLGKIFRRAPDARALTRCGSILEWGREYASDRERIRDRLIRIANRVPSEQIEREIDDFEKELRRGRSDRDEYE